MDVKTLKEANLLQSRIEKLDLCNNLFYWGTDSNFPEIPTVSRKPKLILEYDDEEDGRSQEPVPMELNEEMIQVLKTWIEIESDRFMTEFEQLKPEENDNVF